jgi:hypothetical protein
VAIGTEVSKGKIYSEFFTNLAVATISAGILVPIFTLSTLSLGLILVCVLATVFFIASAIMAKDIK